MYTIATHNGSYHADDVFAVAVLDIVLNGNIKVVRTRDQALIDRADYVVDVGGVYAVDAKRFDHHQIGGAGKRTYGQEIPYASFGLVWKAYGVELSGSEDVAQNIDEHIVQAIDAGDNGVSLYEQTGSVAPLLVHSFLGSFQPTWKEEKSVMDDAFLKAVSYAKEYLLRSIKISTDFMEAKHIVEEICKQTEGPYIVLDTPYPWKKAVKPYEQVKMVVTKRTDGNWSAEGVMIKEGSFDRRAYFPESWAGLRDDTLQAVTGVSDAIFCHNHRFLAVAGSKEGAVMLAKLALGL